MGWASCSELGGRHQTEMGGRLNSELGGRHAPKHADGAVLINVSRYQGEKQGVSILMATLSNSQKTATFDIQTNSGSNDAFVNNLAKGISIECTDEKR